MRPLAMFQVRNGRWLPLRLAKPVGLGLSSLYGPIYPAVRLRYMTPPRALHNPAPPQLRVEGLLSGVKAGVRR